VEKGDITIQPYALKKPIEIKANGQGRFIDNQRQPLTYDFSAEILKSQVKIQGETALKTGESQTNLQIDSLNLNELLTLIPRSNFQTLRPAMNETLATTVTLPVTWLLTAIISLGGVIATLAGIIYSTLTKRIDAQDRMIEDLKTDIERMRKGCGIRECIWKL
jgi:hypothetical protein